MEKTEEDESQGEAQSDPLMPRSRAIMFLDPVVVCGHFGRGVHKAVSSM